MGIDIYTFLQGINPLDEIRVRVFDCSSERCVFNKASDLLECGILIELEETNRLDAYEIESVDVFWCEDEKRICFEFNVSIDEDEADMFEEVI